MFMIFFPLATFYISFFVIFKQNPDMLSWSGIFAVIAANLVIVAYVIDGWSEDDEGGDTSKRQHKRTLNKES